MVVACHWCILMCLICLGRQKMKAEGHKEDS